jgi:hypothetical protein
LKNAKNFRFQSSFKKIKAINTAFQAAWQARTLALQSLHRTHVI